MLVVKVDGCKYNNVNRSITISLQKTNKKKTKKTKNKKQNKKQKLKFKWITDLHITTNPQSQKSEE